MATRRDKLPCGCRLRVAFYKKRPWMDWGRIDVSPSCDKRSHWAELIAATKS